VHTLAYRINDADNHYYEPDDCFTRHIESRFKARMDEQRVEACLMLPTTGVGVEPQLRETPAVLYPSVRAFNRWLEEDWGSGRDGRIYGAALLSLFDLQEALTELERVLACGARFVVLTAGPVSGRSPGDPYFDPFWARCDEAGVNVVYHIGRTPFSEMYNTPWGLRPHPPSHRHSLMEFALSFTERPIVDTLTALIADNVFGRFPRLKVLSVEYGSSWVVPLLHKLDHIARLYSKGMWRFGVPPLTPSETFRQHVWVAPFYEDDVVALAQRIGPNHVLNGSDYPHPEGLAWPMEFVEELDGLSGADIRLVMRDNFGALVGGAQPLRERLQKLPRDGAVPFDQRKHCVAFAEAESVFADEHALFMSDPEHSEDEDRFLLLGLSSALRTLVVCHCFREREDLVRIISARKAAPSERSQYTRRWKR